MEEMAGISEAADAVMAEFPALKGVIDVSVTHTALPVTVTILRDAHEKERYDIYELEWEFMRRFPWVLFDWRVRYEESD